MPKQVQPIQKSVKAKPHTPVYRMHRYFARRPYSVFAELINHYSDPGDVVLDPFCGGGVTLVEGVLQKRRVIGFDINPLASFITRMELANLNLKGFLKSIEDVKRDFEETNNNIFHTTCDKCGVETTASWFEYSALAHCDSCSNEFRISEAKKTGIGTWSCPNCQSLKHFTPQANTKYDLIHVYYTCSSCGNSEIRSANAEDIKWHDQVNFLFDKEKRNGLWVPTTEIPDCNMQRESALFKKGITQFQQLFTTRHLLALGKLHEIISKQETLYKEWLLFAFSSSLRYTNRMVTRNIDWRGNRPLEWAKPGYWLPPVHLEANVLEEFLRRCDAVYRGKKDYLDRFDGTNPKEINQADKVLSGEASSYYVGTLSSTQMPLPDHSVDVVITDPPYGSYVQYADLCNFWSVWLPEIKGLGSLIDTKEEAVIARKSFPGAKNASDYQNILERTFNECGRVLKPGGYMVMTFHNREPRAWAALLVSITKAGFELPSDGIIFQDGIQSYKHTAQSRRAGSVIGDFILSFRKLPVDAKNTILDGEKFEDISEDKLLFIVEQILRNRGPMRPDELLSQFYLEIHPQMLYSIRTAVYKGNGAAQRLIEQFEDFQLFDSHRRQLLEQYFAYSDGKWSLKRGM